MTGTGLVYTFLHKFPSLRVLEVSFDLEVVLLRQHIVVVEEFPFIVSCRYYVNMFLLNGIIGFFFFWTTLPIYFYNNLKQLLKLTITLSSLPPIQPNIFTTIQKYIFLILLTKSWYPPSHIFIILRVLKDYSYKIYWELFPLRHLKERTIFKLGSFPILSIPILVIMI